jgi:ABC-type transport system involved in multi-copper enzyme maturation permease subunit
MIRFELLKMRRSRRPLLAVGMLLLFLGLMLVGFYTYAKTETGGSAEFRYTFENRSYFNGLTFALYAFYFGFLLLLPVLVATEGAVQIAGETASGTLLHLLCRPITRLRIFLGKFGVVVLFQCALTGFLLAAGLSIGLFAVGFGELRLYPGVLQMTATPQTLSQSEALTRFLLAWPAASLALLPTISLSFLLSTWIRHPVNAVGTAVSLYLVLYVVSEIHFFHELRPFLFPSYVCYWRGLFQEQVDVAALWRDAGRLLAFSCLFLGISFALFRRCEEA